MPTSIDNPMTPAFRFIQHCNLVMAKSVPAGDGSVHEVSSTATEPALLCVYSRCGYRRPQRLA